MTDTPTSPMMLKQRAGLVDWLRHPCAETPDLDANDMATAADQLEADSITIATLTAERDAAQAELSSKEDIIARLTAALATPDQIAALATKVDASQAPNPAVNGGSCQSDTITLPRAEVEDVADTLNLVADWMEKAAKDRRIIGPEFHVPTLRNAIATLQERMK